MTLLITNEYTFFWVYLTELYPAQIRIIGVSFVTVMGGVAISVSDLLVTVAQNSGFSVMIIFSIFAFISFLASLKLKETIHEPSP